MKKNPEIIIDLISRLPIIKIFSFVADKMNKEVYLVGGFVRDLILDRNRNDIDVLVVGSGVDFAKATADELKIENVNYFKNFGTAHFDYDGMNIEFVGARRESYDRNTRIPVIVTGKQIGRAHV